MGYDGKAMARARAVIAERKQNNVVEQQRRREELYNLEPRLQSLAGEITRLMSSVSLSALKKGTDAAQAVRDVQGQCSAILAERRRLLFSLGYPPDYLDEIFSCPLCRDRGYIEGRPCQCLLDEYKAESIKLLSSVLNLGEQSFELFDISLYEASDGANTAQIRATMSSIRDVCQKYAEDFGPESTNLIFRGSQGLGKTFLSACIARVVLDKGYSVVYDTAVSIFEAFEARKFGKDPDESELAASAVRRCLNCDLLILDDLGTEMSAGYTQTALYTLINTRLINGGKTIISTNLENEELSRRYSPQTASRLQGEYLSLYFQGRDIRKVKKERV